MIQINRKNSAEHSLMEAPSRRSALRAVQAGEVDGARHDHAVDGLVLEAVRRLVEADDKGQAFHIAEAGHPYDVLEALQKKLNALGFAAAVSSRLLAPLETLIVNMGADFAQEMKAKPLYARLEITDHEPADMPKCDIEQAIFIDTERMIGSDSSRRVMKSTYFGTRTAESRQIDLPEMIARSKKKGLLVYFAVPGRDGVRGLTQEDAGLVTLAQGMSGAPLDEQTLETIRALIETGQASPELSALLETMAQLAQVSEQVLTEGAFENPAQLMAQVLDTLSVQIEAVVQEGVVPAAFIEAVRQQIGAMTDHPAVAPFIDKIAVADIVAGNDNVPIAERIDILLEKVEALQVVAGDHPELAQALETLVAETRAQGQGEQADPAVILQTLGEKLGAISAQADVPVAVFEGVATIVPSIAALQEAVIREAPPPELVQAQTLMAAIEKDDIVPEAMTPEVVALIENMKEANPQNDPDIRDAQVQLLADALKGDGTAEFVSTVKAAITSLAAPEILAVLSPSLQAPIKLATVVAAQQDPIQKIERVAAAPASAILQKPVVLSQRVSMPAQDRIRVVADVIKPAVLKSVSDPVTKETPETKTQTPDRVMPVTSLKETSVPVKSDAKPAVEMDVAEKIAPVSSVTASLPETPITNIVEERGRDVSLKQAVKEGKDVATDMASRTTERTVADVKEVTAEAKPETPARDTPEPQKDFEKAAVAVVDRKEPDIVPEKVTQKNQLDSTPAGEHEQIKPAEIKAPEIKAADKPEIIRETIKAEEHIRHVVESTGGRIHEFTADRDEVLVKVLKYKGKDMADDRPTRVFKSCADGTCDHDHSGGNTAVMRVFVAAEETAEIAEKPKFAGRVRTPSAPV